MTEIFKIAADLIIIGLLVVGIFYAIRLERQMAALRAGRADMQRYTQDFSREIGRAETGIKTLKQVSRTTGDELEKLLQQSQVMRDELQFVVERAERLATKHSSGPPRPSVESIPQQPPLRTVATNPLPPADTPVPKSRAERELMQALHKVRGGA